MSQPQPAASDPTRCTSTHWFLFARCELPRAHRDNWHQGRDAAGTTIRFRRTVGVTEIATADGWQRMDIPGPNGQPQPAQPLDLDAIQARFDAATDGPWTVDSSDYATAIHGPAGSSVVAGSRWGGEASVFDADADAVFIAAARADVEQLLARVRQLEAELAKYVGHEPTVAEEMAELRRGYFAAHEVCDAAVLQIVRSETQRPVPEWVAAVRATLDGEPAS